MVPVLLRGFAQLEKRSEKECSRAWTSLAVPWSAGRFEEHLVDSNFTYFLTSAVYPLNHQRISD
jgi:hypothetical protein